MTQPWSIRFPEHLYRELLAHLFQEDDDEHGAVIAAGITTSDRGVRLLAKRVILAEDGIDYVPGERGYRMLTAGFVAQCAELCSSQGLAYLAAHNHGGRDRVAFSKWDMASHERGYPALVDIVDGPVGGLVLAENAIAGDIFLPGGERRLLDHAVVIGSNLSHIFPAPEIATPAAAARYDRQVRLFGELGQERLRELKVGIIGLGGGGSLVNQMLAHLGVGSIVAIDYDRIEDVNLNRIVGSTQADVGTLKVDVAERHARSIQSTIHYEAIAGDVRDVNVAHRLRDVDLLFLAADNMQTRLVFNALVHQYLIPGFQIGAKVRVSHRSECIDEVFAVSRPVLPFAGGGCLLCNNLIPANRLQEEGLSDQDRKAQRYVDSDDELHAPSVITLNSVGAALATNNALLMVMGLVREGVPLKSFHFDAMDQEVFPVVPRYQSDCLHCGAGPKSALAMGDRTRLPCREKVSRFGKPSP